MHDMMRWMEALVERTGAGSLPTIQRLWGAERGQPEAPSESARAGAVRCQPGGQSPPGAHRADPVGPHFLFVIALLVRLSSRGPVFYTQTRVGLDRGACPKGPRISGGERDIGGRPFTIYKFRTMWADAEHKSGAVWAQQRDPRVTPLGRLLRQYRLDSCPSSSTCSRAR